MSCSLPTKPFECNHYLRAGARELMLIEQGYGNRIDPAAGSSSSRLAA